MASNLVPIDRKTAAVLGFLYYKTNPCKHGHNANRLVSTGGCVECNKIRHEGWRKNNVSTRQDYTRSWYDENREHVAEYRRSRYVPHPRTPKTDEEKKQYKRDWHQQAYANKREQLLEASKQWRDKNSQRRRQSAVEWREKNPQKHAVYEALRRSQRLMATPKWVNTDEINTVYVKCQELNAVWGTNFTVDHYIPLKGKLVCGLHVWENLQLLDSGDNSEKHNKWDPDGS